MFLPDLGFRRATALGTLDIGDYLILPYIILLLVAKGHACPRYSKGLRYVLVAFVAWALVGVLTINVRYDYGFDYSTMTFSLLKIAKLVLYGLAGVLTMTKVNGSHVRREFHWSLLGVIIVMAISLLLGPGKDIEDKTNMGYISHNYLSVTAAILFSYCSGLLASGYGSKRWKLAAAVTLVFGLAGILMSEGRGGWVATILAVLYVMWRKGLRREIIALVAGFLMIGYVSYREFPSFQQRLDFTVSPDLRSQTGETTNIAGLDEGGRIENWSEIENFANAPFWGTGFYHRAGLSGIWWNGSHNFFIQMFLETGFAGGGLILLAFARMWVEAGSRVAQQALLTTPLRAALIAAVAGGMSGDYYYGGIALLAVFLVYAPTGALPRMRKAHVVEYVPRLAYQPVAEKGTNWTR